MLGFLKLVPHYALWSPHNENMASEFVTVSAASIELSMVFYQVSSVSMYYSAKTNPHQQLDFFTIY